MSKRRYLLAIACYLAIPAVIFAGGVLHQFIDPEWARRSADYVRDYRWLELLAQGVLMAAGGLALVLWLATCLCVLTARGRSVGWILLAAGGPLGFAFIAALADRAPAADDLHQRIVRSLRLWWRIPIEIAAFVCILLLAFAGTTLTHEVLTWIASIRTGIPVDRILAMQDASSGMYAFGEALEALYLVPLFYLLVPVVFNGLGRRFGRSTIAPG